MINANGLYARISSAFDARISSVSGCGD